MEEGNHQGESASKGKQHVTLCQTDDQDCLPGSNEDAESSDDASKALGYERKRLAPKDRLQRKHTKTKTRWCDPPQLKRKPGRRITVEWTLQEKKRLLEGLKTYGVNDVKSIAKLFNSKTEDDIKAKIFSIQGEAGCDTLNTDGVSREARAPIEHWIYMLGDLVCQEHFDYSQHVTEILAFLSKHGKVEESGEADLSWRKLYKYLHALSADPKSKSLPCLSDLESFVLLELMSELGNTLQTLDTDQQRLLLEYKAQMLNHGQTRFTMPRKKWKDIADLTVKALANDFSGMKDMLVNKGKVSFEQLLETTTQELHVDSQRPSTSKDAPEEASLSLPRKLGSTSGLVSRAGIDSSKVVQTKKCPNQTQTFVKPKHFSLNPLCIPPQLLNFNPKKDTELL